MKYVPKITVFVSALILGIFCHSALQPIYDGFSGVYSRIDRDPEAHHRSHLRFAETKSGTGIGSASDNAKDSVDQILNDAPSAKSDLFTSYRPLKILSKQRANYTYAARISRIQGTVTLRVTFLASGSIGNIVTVRGLPYGLTEQAIMAARKIQFEPEMSNGVPRSTSRPVAYGFNIY